MSESVAASHDTDGSADRTGGAARLLGAADVRRIAAEAGISPTKRFGQNFVIDPGTVRRIARKAEVGEGTNVLEVGPGLGSLTLALLETGANVAAVEIDPALAERLPRTIAEYMPQAAERLTVIKADALTLQPGDLPHFTTTNNDERCPSHSTAVDTAVCTVENAADSGDRASSNEVNRHVGGGTDGFTLVSNLPYNVATPVLLTLLERFPNLNRFVVMVQKEVADRLSAQPGNKVYGAPSVKLAWYGETERVGLVGRNVFWPAPNVDSALVSFTRTSDTGTTTSGTFHPTRETLFRLVDAAFGQRRKTLHAALKGMVTEAEFSDAGIDPTRRGETLTVEEFSSLARACDLHDRLQP